MSNTDDQRAAFEAWAKSMHARTDRYSDGITMEGYRNMSVQLA